MKKVIAVLGAVMGVTLGAGIAAGQGTDAKALLDATKARQAQMQLYGFNLGILGGMARSEIPYDSAAATAAANNLASLTQLNQSHIWPIGSDEMGVEGSRAMAEIWDNLADVMDKGADLTSAATAMQAAAGTDLASLQAAMGALGGACGACHRAYRVPE